MKPSTELERLEAVNRVFITTLNPFGQWMIVIGAALVAVGLTINGRVSRLRGPSGGGGGSFGS